MCILQRVLPRGIASCSPHGLAYGGEEGQSCSNQCAVERASLAVGKLGIQTWWRSFPHFIHLEINRSLKGCSHIFQTALNKHHLCPSEDRFYLHQASQEDSQASCCLYHYHHDSVLGWSASSQGLGLCTVSDDKLELLTVGSSHSQACWAEGRETSDTLPSAPIHLGINDLETNTQ